MHMHEIIQPEGLWDPRPRYAQVLKSGKHAWIAGQVSVDENGSTVGEGDIEAQTRQVFENLRRALESLGAGFDDVVKLHVYSTDIDAHYSTIAAFRTMHFSAPVPSTTLQVPRLVRTEWLLEIEAEVLLP
jgi:enamine deaminase RidA (YjgF/YER057c/UK114 family)